VRFTTASGSLAFLDWALRGDAAPLSAWSAAWGSILAVAPVAFAANG
jgi:hypothetical protein